MPGTKIRLGNWTPDEFRLCPAVRHKNCLCTTLDLLDMQGRYLNRINSCTYSYFRQFLNLPYLAFSHQLQHILFSIPSPAPQYTDHHNCHTSPQIFNLLHIHHCLILVQVLQNTIQPYHFHKTHFPRNFTLLPIPFHVLFLHTLFNL